MSTITCVNGSWIKSDEYRSAENKMEMNSENTSTKQSTTTETTLARSTSTKSNDYDFIEKVVEHIPKCTPEDYIRQRNLLNILQAWSQLAEKHNIQYWISSRTLIGYVQHRGLFPYDKDLDVTMMTYDMPQLINISQSNFSFNYEIRIQPQWEIIGYQNRSYFYSQGIPFIAPNARFYDRKTEYFLDI